MAQEIKLMVRPGIGGKESSVRVEQELNALMSGIGGYWEMRDIFHIGQEKDGSHNVMFVLVRDVGELPVQPVEAAKRGRPPKTE